MKIYTKTGDKGETGLLSGQRVPKDHLRLETYGTLDEASAVLGFAKALLNGTDVAKTIEYLQKDIIFVNADLATQGPVDRYRITREKVACLEKMIDDLESKTVREKGFVLPGKNGAGAALDLARTIIRRAERTAVTLSHSCDVPESIMLYLNRLSDLLFMLARFVEQQQFVDDVAMRVINMLSEKQNVSMLTKAKYAIEKAEQQAEKIGVPVVITFVDASGNMIAMHRMDNSLLASIAISRDKAYAAAALQMSTEKAGSLAQPGAPLYGLNTLDGGRLAIFGGGLPIYEKGKIVGAIGVSGGSVEEDTMVAEAGLAGWKGVDKSAGE